jgi:alcohol dehydrogenase (NADP+)
MAAVVYLTREIVDPNLKTPYQSGAGGSMLRCFIDTALAKPDKTATYSSTLLGLGGLGHLGVKFAKAMGAEVAVFSHSASKRDDALAMGADDFIVTEDPAVFRAHADEFHLLINTVSAPIDLNRYLRLLGRDGTLVMVGLAPEPYPIQASAMLAQRRRIAGSMIGSVGELQEMLDFAAEHDIVSDIEVIDADYLNEAWDRVVAADVRYRFVVDASTFAR